jgi:sec-independent protein translocase protein TatB
MFEVGFSELCLIGLVSLLVIGPEQLPKVARYAGFWIGKSRQMMASVKAEIQTELQAEEMRQLIKEHTDLTDAQHLLDETASAFSATLHQPVIESTEYHELKSNE